MQAHPSSERTFHHPEVGDITLCYQSIQLDGTPGHRLVVFFAAPVSPAHATMLLRDEGVGEADSERVEEDRS
ncbi:hypothetical protein ACQ4WX_49225 [Streptomyces lasalocidi]|uniref:MmyB family transcriptional regulator n=1 Tax=Streptomyces sp. MUSC 14 TaxID=1354889 RepID=UPI0015A4F439